MNKLDPEIKALWTSVVNKTHTEQAIWWLNGFWRELEDEAEAMWDMVHIMIAIECGKEKRYGKLKWEEKEGNDLDQFQSHRFLEKMGCTLTATELTQKVRKLDFDKNKRLALSEYLCDKYNKTVQQVAEAPQGGQAAQDALNRAAKKLENAVALMNSCCEAAEAAEAAKEKSRVAKKAVEAAKAEAKAAVDAVEAQEKERNDKIDKLKQKINNKKLSTMKINTAKNELAQVEGEDPLPLRKAKLTQKAAHKKQKKAAKEAAKEEKKAVKAAEDAQQERVKAEESCKEAQEALTELKENGDGISHGQVWWMEKEFNERQKFMPKR